MTFLMLERLEQQVALHVVARISEIGIEAPLNSARWDIMTHVKFVLKPFEEASDSLGTALGNLIPVTGLLKTKVSKFHQNQTLGGAGPCQLMRGTKRNSAGTPAGEFFVHSGHHL